MEAGWLIAIVALPLFFNAFSSRIFEPDKITLLRSLALFILGAWLVKMIDTGRSSFHKDGVFNPLKSLLRIPLFIPVIVLFIVYIFSNLLSITPAVSFWGSYQRLQGTYTTFAYLIIFAALAGNLRKQIQVERIITTLIVASLPIVLYGILQHYKLDPVGWVGDTSTRISSTLGNSIFIAAYLIMVFPLTASRIVTAFQAILGESADQHASLANLARATAYVFIAALQVIALYMSGSRGPALGWLVGCFMIGLLLSLLWRKRWMTFTMVGAAAVVGLFLLVFNISGGPLEKLRSSPAIGRFGNLLNAESNSALVRRYIWEGVVKLVQEHKPLEYPDGHTDSLNPIRLVIGYGPESMYVAYNRYYLPALGQVEKRNAAPDRSHNETWDALVTMGIAGVFVYLFVFASVFYYGFKWLGLVANQKRKRLFWILYAAGGLAGAIFFSAWRGVEYLGVGLPFGIVGGLVIFLILVAAFPAYHAQPDAKETRRAMLIIGLLVAIVSHFLEINFGIAVSVTRAYFWIYTGLILLVGYILPRLETQEAVIQPSLPDPADSSPGTPRKKRRSEAMPRRRVGEVEAGKNKPWLREALVNGLLMSVILVTLGYDFIGNSSDTGSALGILWSSLATLKSTSTVSLGLLGMILVAWLVASLTLSSESWVMLVERDSVQQKKQKDWLASLAISLGISCLAGFIYWLWRSASFYSLVSMTPADIAGVLKQVDHYKALLGDYYIYLFVLLFLIASCLSLTWPVRLSFRKWYSVLTAVILLGLAIGLVNRTNLRVIQADMAFKSAEAFTQPNYWPVAIEIYQVANQLAPEEDYYYLFLGRAYIEYARSVTTVSERDGVIARAEQDLVKAQALNPLNTDHTANLGRLYSLWATYATDAATRLQRAQKSAQYFSRAVVLSPNTVRLWVEWAIVSLNSLQEPDKAYEYLQKARSIDVTYDWTYAILGDYYLFLAKNASEGVPLEQFYQKAQENYLLAISKKPAPQMKYSYLVSLAGIQTKMDLLDQAIITYQQAIDTLPNSADNWYAEQFIARLYQQKGDGQNALLHAQKALDSAPEAQRSNLQNLINELTGSP